MRRCKQSIRAHAQVMLLPKDEKACIRSVEGTTALAVLAAVLASVQL